MAGVKAKASEVSSSHPHFSDVIGATSCAPRTAACSLIRREAGNCCRAPHARRPSASGVRKLKGQRGARAPRNPAHTCVHHVTRDRTYLTYMFMVARIFFGASVTLMVTALIA